MRLKLTADPAARRRLTALGAVGLASLALGAAIGAGDDGSPEPAAPSQAEREEPVAELSLPEQVGQLVLVRFDGTELPDYVVKALRKRRAAGVILFTDNVLTEEQLQSLTTSVQRAAGDAAIVATDQEGGLVRNVPFVEPEAAPPELTTRRAALTTARLTARDLRALGVNVNLAPVADVPTGSGSALAGRAYPGDSGRVAALVEEAVRGYADGRVAATAKHFPGLGAATENTDDAAVTIPRPASQLERVDLEPFRAAIAADVPLVMASHALYPQLDRERIASQSPVVLDELLRGELRFEGTIVTDSLEAQAVLDRAGTPTAAVRSLEAGADLLLTTSSGSYPPVFERVIDRARRSDAFRARVEEAAARVLALKERMGLRLPASGG